MTRLDAIKGRRPSYSDCRCDDCWLLAQVEALRGALEPFALLGTELRDGDGDHVPCSVRRDDLMRVIAALAALEEPE